VQDFVAREHGSYSSNIGGLPMRVSDHGARSRQPRGGETVE
jgi:hypothetical protein